jgi:hypothetical protein
VCILPAPPDLNCGDISLINAFAFYPQILINSTATKMV